jgi:hypothetical protein
MSARIPRDPAYGKPPLWGRLYAKHFPEHTDPSSRHVKVIAESLRRTDSPLRKLLHDAGYEPDHMARSMEATVEMLWEMRAALQRGDGK